MGVHGLWQLVEPTGRPVTLESLEGKVLAVDISIWLHHLVKGMRDRYGNSVPNAHLLGLFNRVCKLLYYRIKPVFVFDGGVPELKKQTMASRRQRKEDASASSAKTAKKLLDIMVKHHAVSTVLGTAPSSSQNPDSDGATVMSLTPGQVAPLSSKSKGSDMFQLPALPEEDRPIDPVAHDNSWEERMEMRNELFEGINLDEIDTECEDFLCLPPEIRHEILSDMKEIRKRSYLSNMEELPSESNDFSAYQMKKLLKQSKLSQKIVQLRQEINLKDSGDLTTNLTPNQRITGQIESRRIVSEDSSHYILIKGLKNMEDGEKEPVDSAKAVQEIFLQKQKENEVKREENIKLRFTEGKIKEEIVIDDDDNLNDIGNNSEIKDIVVLTENNVKIRKLENESRIDLSLDDHSRDIGVNMEKKAEIIIDDNSDADNGSDSGALKEKIPQKAYRKLPSLDDVQLSSEDEESQETNFKDKLSSVSMNAQDTITSTKNTSQNENFHRVSDDFISEGGFIQDDGEEKSDVGIINENMSLEKCAAKPETISDNVIDDKISVADDDICITDVEPAKRPAEIEDNCASKRRRLVTGSESPLTHLNEETGEVSDDGEEFLEVTIDTSNIQPDEELFPASVFTQHLLEGDEDKKKSQETTESADVIDIPVDADEYADLRTDQEQEQTEEDKEDEIHFPIPSEFEGMNETELTELQGVLEKESAELHSTKQQQDRVGVSITDQMYIEAQELLTLFGLPYLISPMEAEAQCAFLDLTNQTQGTITDDSDIWLFGGKRVYKNFFNQSKNVEFYKDSDVKTQMLLDRTKMINIALLCGSDYTDGIQGVGPVTAMEILGEFPGSGVLPLQNFKKWWDVAHQQVKVPPAETKVKSKLRQLQINNGFPSEAVVEAYLDPTLDDSEEPFSWGKLDVDILRGYASEKLGWTKTKSDEVLLPMMKRNNQKQTQMHITSYTINDTQENKKLKSKRVKRILNKMRTDHTNPAELEIEASPTVQISASKGKATRNTQPKNFHQKKDTIETSGGGWCRSLSAVAPPVHEVELSESSSDSNFGFGGNDSDDALLGAIDLDKIQNDAVGTLPLVQSKKGSGENLGKGRGKGRGKARGKACQKAGPNKHQKNTQKLLFKDCAPEMNKETSAMGNGKTNCARKVNKEPTVSNIDKKRGRGRGRGRGKGKALVTENMKISNMNDEFICESEIGSAAKPSEKFFDKTDEASEYFNKASRGLKKVTSGNTKNRKCKVQARRPALEVQLSESDSESD